MHASVELVEGWGCLLHTLDTTEFYYVHGILMQYGPVGVNEICRALDGAPVCITVTFLHFRPGNPPSDLAIPEVWR